MRELGFTPSSRFFCNPLQGMTPMRSSKKAVSPASRAETTTGGASQRRAPHFSKGDYPRVSQKWLEKPRVIHHNPSDPKPSVSPKRKETKMATQTPGVIPPSVSREKKENKNNNQLTNQPPARVSSVPGLGKKQHPVQKKRKEQNHGNPKPPERKDKNGQSE